MPTDKFFVSLNPFPQRKTVDPSRAGIDPYRMTDIRHDRIGRDIVADITVWKQAQCRLPPFRDRETEVKVTHRCIGTAGRLGVGGQRLRN